MAATFGIDVYEARERVTSGAALLVCGYEDNARFNKMKVEGALSFQELTEQLPTLAKDQELIFYCA